MTSFALVKDYLVYSTDAGLLSHFYIDEWEFVSKYTHATGIKKIFPEPFGMSIAFIDDASEGFIYNPVNSNVVKIPYAIAFFWIAVALTLISGILYVVPTSKG